MPLYNTTGVVSNGDSPTFGTITAETGILGTVAKVGRWVSSATTALFSHINHNTATGYFAKQNADGFSVINGATGQGVDISVGGVTVINTTLGQVAIDGDLLVSAKSFMTGKLNVDNQIYINSTDETGNVKLEFRQDDATKALMEYRDFNDVLRCKNKFGPIEFHTETNGTPVLAMSVLADGGISMVRMKSGTTQGGAGATANELWQDTGDNSIKIGV